MGSLRGIIKEFFELLIVSAGVLITTFIYPPISDLFVTYLHSPVLVASTVSFFAIFAVIAVTLWIYAGKAEIAANVPHTNIFNRIGGTFLALCKGAILLWALLFLFGVVDTDKDSRAFFRGSMSVVKIQELSPLIDNMFDTLGSRRAFRSILPLIKKSVF